MKNYVETFESFTHDTTKREKMFRKIGKLEYEDQFVGRVSLSKVLSEITGHKVAFDYISLYDNNSNSTKTIMDDALSGKYTFDEILKHLENWIKKQK
jgi:hypothetical protein